MMKVFFNFVKASDLKKMAGWFVFEMGLRRRKMREGDARCEIWGLIIKRIKDVFLKGKMATQYI